MTTLPDDAIPVIDWPEYVITPRGEAWRIAPYPPMGRGRQWGAVPRFLQPIMVGGRKDGSYKHQAFKFSRDGKTQTRTIQSLVRQHFGEST